MSWLGSRTTQRPTRDIRHASIERCGSMCRSGQDGAGTPEHFCRIGVVLVLADEPITAMDAHEYWCIGTRRTVDIRLLHLSRTISFAPRHPEPRAHSLLLASRPVIWSRRGACQTSSRPGQPDNHQTVQQVEADGGNHEQVHGSDVRSMVAQGKYPPLTVLLPWPCIWRRSTAPA